MTAPAIQFGEIEVTEWTKDGAQLPVLKVPVLSGSDLIARIELWVDLVPDGDGAFVAIGTAARVAVVPHETLQAMGFRLGMREKRVTGKETKP